MNLSLKKLSRKTYRYIPLIGIFTATVLGFWIFSYDKAFQLALGIAAASGYVAWGLVYHHIHKNLYLSTVIEYIAMAIFGVVALFFLLFRA